MRYNIVSRSGQFLSALVVGLVLFSSLASLTQAAPAYTINYQGKLTDTVGLAVADGLYDMEFALYDQASGGVALWTETLTGADQVQVTNGLFSVMLGSTTPLTGVDFNQALYLGVNIESDGEMTPRKPLGTVPSAFEARRLGGVASSSFLRSDTADTASGLLTFSGGFLSTASSTLSALNFLNATGTSLYIGGDRITDFVGTGLSLSGNTLTASLGTTIAAAEIADGDHGFFSYASGVASLDTGGLTSANVSDALTNETGTGNAVFSASPTFTGTIDAAAATLSSTLTLSGSLANIALGSNYLSGDGGDEGVSVDSTGRVTLTGTSGSVNSILTLTNTSTAVGAGNRINFINSSSNGAHITQEIISSGNSDLYFTVRGSNTLFERMRLTATGNLGVGDSTPDDLLNLHSSTTQAALAITSLGTDTDSLIKFELTDGTATFSMGVDDSDSDKFKISTTALGTNDRLVIDSSGNVGIGTSTPLATLSVAGDLRLTGMLRDTSNDAGTSGQVLLSTGTGTNWVATSSLGISGTLSNDAVIPDYVLSTGQTDEFCLTYEATGDTWEWQTCGAGGGLTSGDIDTSSELAAILGDETGSGALVFGTSPTFTTSANFGTAGVRLVDDGDGALTFLGLGDGSDEDLTLNLDDTANTGVFTSSTGLNLLTFSDIGINTTSNSGYSFYGTRYLYASTTNDSIVFGENAGATLNSGTTDNVMLGFEAGRYASTSGVDRNNLIGYQAGHYNLGGNNNLFGGSAGASNTGSHNNFLGSGVGSSNTGSHNNAMGFNAAVTNNGSNNNFFGYQSGQFNDGSYNNFLGLSSGQNNQGHNNNFFGSNAGQNNITGSSTSLIGYQTGRYLNASNTIAIGGEALFGSHATSFISANTIALGYRAGYASNDGAGNNILIGHQAADNLTTGNNNIIIGYDIDSPSATADNILNIGNLLFGTGIDGTGTTLSSGNIGVGTSSPVAKLAVTNSGSGLSFLVEDQASADASPFVIDTSGNVGIGDLTPNAKLDLDVTQTSGTLINVSAPSAVNTSGLTGFNLDMRTNYTANNASITGAAIRLPDSANTTVDSYDQIGLIVGTSGASLTHTTGSAGISGFTGIDLYTPNISYTAPVLGVTAVGMRITTGTLTAGSAASQTGLAISAQGVAAGTLYGMNIGNITAGAGTERAINIGTGWDNAIYSSATAASYFAGALSVGDTVPDNLLDVHAAAAEAAIAITSVGNNTDVVLKFELSDGTANFSVGVDDSDFDKFKISTTNLGTNDRLVIDSSGNVGIGTSTPAGQFDVYEDTATNYAARFTNDGNNANRYGLLVQAGLDDHTAAGPSTLIQFNDGDGGSVGSITFGSSATAFNTTSDRRLKTNIVDTALGMEELMAIQVRDYNWIADADKSTLTHGFIAQELYEIFPQAVTVPKESNKFWMVDYSKLTPLIIAGVQEQQAVIEEQETSLATLGSGLLETISSVADLEAAVMGGISQRYRTTDTNLDSAELVTLTGEEEAQLKKATRGDTVFGVVATTPGLVLSNNVDDGVPVALTGAVPVKVNMEGGSITVGDPIALSSQAGVGTKATTTTYIIGRAIEATDTDGVVLVSIHKEHYYAPVLTESLAALFTPYHTDAPADTLWSRLTTLADNFVAGVLSVTGVQTEELCVGSVCVDEATFLEMVQDAGGQPSAPTEPPPPEEENQNPPPEEDTPPEDDPPTPPEEEPPQEPPQDPPADTPPPPENP